MRISLKQPKQNVLLRSSVSSLAALVFALLMISAVGCKSGIVESNQGTLGTNQYSLMAVHNTNSLQSVCSIKVPEPEPADLTALATITAEDAKAVALDTFPGTKANKVELDNENGCLVWGIELDNGADVKVDAGNGVFLYADTDEDGGTESSSNEDGGN